MPDPSEMDNEFHLMIRQHINRFQWTHAITLASRDLRRLCVGPSNGEIEGWSNLGVDTLDIVPGGTFTGDVTKTIEPIAVSTYDVVFAFEVIEHTVDPFAAIAEMRRLLKPGGLLLMSAPFNAREHGPLPDCWRFSRNGWRILLRNFDDVTLDVLMTPGRPLMPLHICVSARCDKDKDVDPRTMTFAREDS